MTLATAFAISKVCIVLAVILLGIVAYLKFNPQSKTTATVGGSSAFVKLDDAAKKQKDAEAKISAVKELTKVRQDAASNLKKAAVEAHGELDKAHEELDHVHEILG